MQTRRTIDIQEAKQRFNYCPETGELTYKKQIGRMRPGERAGFFRKDGYLYVRVMGTQVMGHRVIFALMTGETPLIIDHINNNPSDNRWSNLRACSYRENNLNTKKRVDNKSGYRGVYFHILRNKWVAQISINGKRVYLGLHDTKEAAFDTYKKHAAISGNGFIPIED